MGGFIMLKGRLVQLKAVNKQNIPMYVKWLNDFDVRRYLAVDAAYPMTLAEEEGWFEASAKQENQKPFAIHELENDQLIGNVGLHNINGKNQSAIIGIFIGNKDYWGKGYGTEAMRLCLYIAFQELNLNRVELGVFDFNTRGIKSYKKLGFVEEGRKRKAIYRDGEFHDEIVMSILREEYLKFYQKEDEERWKEFY